MDSAYVTAMREHLEQLSEELNELKTLAQQNELNTLMQRASERTLQILVEACIGIAKQTLKAQGRAVPTEAREAFRKLQELKLDHSGTDWNKVVGLRNALVHDYLNLDKQIIQEIILKERFASLFEFATEQLDR